MTETHRHRRCIVLRGEREATRAEAHRLVSALGAVAHVDASHRSRSSSQRLLGQSFDAVVLDLHSGASAEALGRCHGLVRGGGALVLCMPPPGHPIAAAELAVYPFTAADVGTHFWSRLERHLESIDIAPPSEPLSPAPSTPAGSAEQAGVVARLARAFGAAEPSLIALIAERGRGKSSALGLALRAVLAGPERERAASDFTPSDRWPQRALVTAPSESAALELLRFASPCGDRLRFVPPSELLEAPADADIVVVDEAAQLPLPLLFALVSRQARATIAFATTTHGYEGTGRGFVLRFLEWLAAETRPTEQLTLVEPIRWSAGDPLERFVYRLLALDVDVARPTPAAEALLAPRRIDKSELAGDEALLRSLFALLVHAHYRTTPADLERLLDAPNLAVHAIVADREVLGATLVAREGALPRSVCEALARGEWRIRGHALADTLIVHAGRADAGELSLVRSVRIAAHPELRRRGIARELVEHIHASYAPDLFGTIFGATPPLLAFRRALGYSLVRVGSSRGISSGEPPAVFLRAGTSRGAALIADLVADLARNLPLQLELLATDGELSLEPALERELGRGLPAPTDLGLPEIQTRVERFAAGAQTLEAAVYALSRYISEHPDRLARLQPNERRLLECRLLGRASWRASARAAGYAGAPAAMKAVRPAIRKLLEP